jgi:hypothetical protein
VREYFLKSWVGKCKLRFILLMLDLIIMFYELKSGHNVVVNFW